MITCNRCGQANPADAMSCQKCGAPLATNKQEYVLGTRMSAPDQQELPAWLESLRAGERAGGPVSPSAANPANFSGADLIDGGALPSWMRSNDVSDPGLSGPQSVIRPSMFSAPTTDSGFGSGQAIPANSLVDEKSLPDWMQPEKPQSNIAASSLVQADSMPEWLKAMQPSQPQPSQPQQPVQRQPSQPVQRPMEPSQGSAFNFSAPQPPAQRQQPSQGFSARDLIDDQALPEWMMNAQSQPPQVPGGVGQGQVPGGVGQPQFSASSLVDAGSLPPWMQDSGPRASISMPSSFAPPSAPTSFGQQPVQQSSFGQQPVQQSPFGQQPVQQSPFGQQPAASGYNNAVWPGQNVQPAQTPPAPAAPNQFPYGDAPAASQGNVVSASSFIDPNALPEWLRNVEGPGAGQRPVPGRPGQYGAQRVDNVRVPSRPRAEMGPSGENEEAANVFASMLGVASNTPNFPQAAPQPGYGAPTPGNSYGLQGIQGSQPPQGAPAPQGIVQTPNTPGGYSGTGPQAVPGYSGMGAQQPYPGAASQPASGARPQTQQPGQGYGQLGGQQGQGYGQPGGQQGQGYGQPGGQQGQGGYNNGNIGSLGVAQDRYGSAMSSMGGPQGGGMGSSSMYSNQGNDPGMQEKPAKRGLFDAIRSLFFRQ